MSSEEKKELYGRLKKHKGAVNEICGRFGCSREWYSQVIKHQRYEDDDLLLIAVQVLKEREEKRKEKREQLQLEFEALNIRF